MPEPIRPQPRTPTFLMDAMEGAPFENRAGLYAAHVLEARKLRPQVILLGLVSLLNDSASEMIYPLLPVFLTTTLGATPLIVGLIEGSADALAALSRGWIAVAGRWPSVLAARLLDRTGKGIRSAPRDALIADVTPEESRGKAFGFHRALDHTGAVVGPLLALLFLNAMHLPMRTVFMIAVIPGAIGVVLLLIAL